jgi:hypothetical protein
MAAKIPCEEYRNEDTLQRVLSAGEAFEREREGREGKETEGE